MKSPSIILLIILLSGIQLFSAPAVASGDLTLSLIQSSNREFSEPHDIVLSPDGSLLFVADNGNDRIVVLDAFTLERRATLGEGLVAAPHDVCFDSDGRLLVADTGNNRIAVLELKDLSASLVGEMSERILSPEGVAVHADGRVFATGAGSGNLVVYKDGKVVAEAEGFSAPHDVELDREGRIWVADANHNRMVQLDDKLKVSRTVSGAPFNLSGPRYMDFDGAGRMFVADKYSNSIKVVTPEGKLLQVLGGGNSRLFDRPEGVEILGSDLWFSDTYNNRIVRYRMVP